MQSIESDHFIYSTPALSVLIFPVIEHSALMALDVYYKDMLEKVTMQRTKQFSAFVCYQNIPLEMQCMCSCSKT